MSRLDIIQHLMSQKVHITISFQVHCFYGNDPQNTDLSRFYYGPVDYTHTGPKLYQGPLFKYDVMQTSPLLN